MANAHHARVALLFISIPNDHEALSENGPNKVFKLANIGYLPSYYKWLVFANQLLRNRSTKPPTSKQARTTDLTSSPTTLNMH